ncbi:bi-domain-containing oxidoreductase [Pseudomonadales bacterium]|nr:bi-domain-containing oxidoreductase [Pseudomonadales bacterium]
MKLLQILQDLKNGDTNILDVPAPRNVTGALLIRSATTVVSAGTERMLVNFGKANYVEKAMQQPDKVKMVLDKVKTDGLIATIDTIQGKLNQPLPLGYCNAGVVVESMSSSFDIGDRVASNGAHAEIVRVPQNLCAKIPDNVDDESAAFTVIGAVALQGVRLANPLIGETVVVSGLGLIGLIAVQILKANGCQVLGIDFDENKCALARQFGAETVNLSETEDPVAAAKIFSRGRGIDAVLITASTDSSELMHQSANMLRKRGRIILVGVVGLDLSRADFYEKEITFQVSCSYGPGRHDEAYEQDGVDYPFGFVRWTEQRNFEAILDLMASGAINMKPLISHRFQIDDAAAAYEKLDDRSSLGILLNYQRAKTQSLVKNTVKISANSINAGQKGNVAFVGGGNYASRVLIPAFKRTGANLTALVTSSGMSAFHHGKKNGFETASTDIKQAFTEQTDTVVIATQHNLHASQTLQALENGKHVFVEKPLALTHEDIDSIEAFQKDSNTMVMVGYNRRFSPHIQKIKSLLHSKPSPKTFIMTMNAGEIPQNHWTQDAQIGGGRIIGEACHYIDLMRFLAGSKIKSFYAVKMGKNDFVEVTEDKALISLTFEDGSMGSIHYFANGGQSFPKERIEVFCDNAVLQLDNFRKLHGFGWKGFTNMNLWSQDKGQRSCVDAFMKSVREGGENPIPQDEIFEVAHVSVDIAEMLRA